jgi:catechol 2,3-dioxygenase-like lactoylglutathione lyase family enzyme
VESRRAEANETVRLRRPAAIFPVQDPDVAFAFYERLGFRVSCYDFGYGYATRDRLRLHLRLSPEVDPFTNSSAVYVDTAGVDALHAEWLACRPWVAPTNIGPELHAEARRRRAAGQPVGRITDVVGDKPWGVREFAILDPNNNQLRFHSQLPESDAGGAVPTGLD